MRNLFSLLATTLLMALPTLARAAEFAPPVDYATGAFPRSVIAGDFNKDGNPDLAVVNSEDSTISILLGNGDGTFQSHVDYATGYGGYAVAAGDFNGDGSFDLIVTNYGLVGGNSVSLLLGNGDGTFRPHVDFTTGGTPLFVVASDLNRDGKLDVITANNTGGSVSVLLGNGDGTFGPHEDYHTGLSPVSVIARDFNRDGIMDLAVANSGIVCCGASSRVGSITILFGKGDGTFSSKTNYAAGNEPYSLATADFNHDGFADLVAVNYAGGLGQSVSVLLGNAGGTFGAAVPYPTGAEADFVAAADVNKDGVTDLVVADASGQVTVLAGIGDGTFQNHVDYKTGGEATSVAIADFNHDGLPDLATSNGSTYTVSILLNLGN